MRIDPPPAPASEAETRETDHADGRHLTLSAARRRASAGVFYLFSTGLLLLVVGFAGNLALARLLSPRDFGLVALGVTVITLSQTISDGGLAAALIRQEREPSRNELRSLMGLQLTITLVIAAVAMTVALQFGEAGAIAGVMVLSLPISAFQTASRVLLIRDLAFGKTSIADTTAMLSFYFWSVGAAVLGAGAWSMATGTVVRAIVATFLIVALSGVRLGPSLRRMRRLGPLIRFGVPFQLTWIVQAAREQLLNVGTAIVGGVAILGQWSLATRIMQLPQLLFQSVAQVAYPAMSRILAGREEATPVLERGTRIAAIVAALSLAPFAAAAPTIVPVVFGQRWADAAIVIPLSALGTLILGPIYVTGSGYLNAMNKPTDVLRSVVQPSIVMIPVSLALLPVLGIVALGIGWVVNAVLEGLALDRYVRRTSGARLVAQVVAPVTIGLASGVVGILVGQAGSETVGWSCAAAASAFACGVAGLVLACKTDLALTVSVLWRTVTDGTRGARRASRLPESQEGVT